jgi:hypothetical protein
MSHLNGRAILRLRKLRHENARQLIVETSALGALRSGSLVGMPRSQSNEAVDAHDTEVVEFEKAPRLASLAEKETLAVVTPRLPVIRIFGVLYEAHGSIERRQVMPADDGTRPVAMDVADDRRWRIARAVRHQSVLLTTGR